MLLLDAQATAGDPARGALVEIGWARVVGGRGPRADRRRGDRARRGSAARGRRAARRGPAHRAAHRGVGARDRAGPGVGTPPARGRTRSRTARPRARRRPLRPLRGAVPAGAARAPRRGPVPPRPRLHARHRLPAAPGAAPPHAARAGRLLRGRRCRPCAAAPTTWSPPRSCGATWSRCWPSARASSASTSSASGWRGRPAASPRRFPLAARAPPRAARPPGRLPAAARGRRRALRRQGRLAAPARERPLPRRAGGRARAGDAHAGPRRVLHRDRDRARGGPAGGGRDQAAGPAVQRRPGGGRAGGLVRDGGPASACRRGRTRTHPVGPARLAGAHRGALGAARRARASAGPRPRSPCAPARSGSSPPGRPGPECFAAGLARFVQRARPGREHARPPPARRAALGASTGRRAVGAGPDGAEEPTPRRPAGPPGTRSG